MYGKKFILACSKRLVFNLTILKKFQTTKIESLSMLTPNMVTAFLYFMYIAS